MDECAQERKLLSEEFQNCRKVFLALGDETRQHIFTALLENENIGMRVPDITAKTHLSRPAVSHHLRILRDAGLINLHRSGTMNFYYVEADKSCWSGLQELTGHVLSVISAAEKNDYPRFSEDQRP